MKITSTLILIACLACFTCNSQSPTSTRSDKFSFDLSFLDKELMKSGIDSSGYLIFNDSIIEKKIRAALHIKAEMGVPASIADTVTLLDLSNGRSTPVGQQIEKVDVLAFFRNLKKLNLQNNQIRNLTPLGQLTQLTELNAQNNRIFEISGLGNLQSLEKLNLYANGVSDISCLSELQRLTELNLYANQVYDLKSLQELKNLTSLNLGMNQIRDISPLLNSKKLKVLWLIGNYIDNPEVIAEIGDNLEVLSLTNCRISKINFLENCTKLKSLMISGNSVKDISILRNMVNLNTLYASGNQIENIDVIAFLVRMGAFRKSEGFRNPGSMVNTNIDLSGNKIDYQNPVNQKIRQYLTEKIPGVVF